MFGGQGIFVDGLMIALISADVIYLKADAETVQAFESEGLAPVQLRHQGWRAHARLVLADAGPPL